jgi:Fe-only nitrogenase accessory protein AnfO
MKIASYVNANGAVVGFQEKGQICLYEKEAENWVTIKEVPLDLNPDLPLAEIKTGIREAVTELDDCKVFVVKEFRGLLNAVLQEEFGFRTWKSEGSLLEQLDSVEQHDKEFVIAEAARNAASHTCSVPTGGGGCGGGCSSGKGSPYTYKRADHPDFGKAIPAPQSVGDGCYRINLANILANDSSLNSKQVLVPFMEGVTFKQLEVLCDHPPRWFARELYKLNLTVASEQPNNAGKGCKVLVVPIKADTAQPA